MTVHRSGYNTRPNFLYIIGVSLGMLFCSFFNKMCSRSLSKLTLFLFPKTMIPNSIPVDIHVILLTSRCSIARIQQARLPDEFSTFLGHPISSGVVLEFLNNRCVSPSVYHLSGSSSSWEHVWGSCLTNFPLTCLFLWCPFLKIYSYSVYFHLLFTHPGSLHFWYRETKSS